MQSPLYREEINPIMAKVATTDRHATPVATDVDAAYVRIIWLLVDDIINSMSRRVGWTPESYPRS
jgi:hypothetical protein